MDNLQEYNFMYFLKRGFCSLISLWDQGKIGIKFGAKHGIYKKLAI